MYFNFCHCRVWSMGLKNLWWFFHYSKVDNIYRAEACKVIPANSSNPTEVVPLHKVSTSYYGTLTHKLAGSSKLNLAEEIFFVYRKQKFFYSKEKDTFHDLSYPTNETMGYYLGSRGYSTEDELEAAKERWGKNKIKYQYPRPTFAKLMKLQCTQPLFVLQACSTALWCLHGLWIFCIYALFMLFLFESAIARRCMWIVCSLQYFKFVQKQRLRVYRCGVWVNLRAKELLPGDIVSIVCFIPADVLILAGSVTVNEAIITGDPTPQRKVGDPLEKAALKGIGWIYNSDEMSVPNNGYGSSIQILKRYHFASNLRRMAAVVRVDEQFFSFVKGAPETIQERLVHMPEFYVETYKKYARQGSRVLALAYKSLAVSTVTEARSLERGVAENGLTFAGFAVFNCPIRKDSATVLSELKGSSHDLVMITGDEALTACHVAGQVKIITKPVLLLVVGNNSDGYQWVSPDESRIIQYRDNAVKFLTETYDLCIGGDCIEMLLQTSGILRVIPYVKVFARMAPEQKELIITTLKMVGRVTLMCGNGINDVGALQQAHVAVGLPNSSHVNQDTDVPLDAFSRSACVACFITASDIKLGDALLTSSFLVGHTSIAPILDLIRQGRSAVALTQQILKILFLRSCYLISLTYLYGVKMSIIQATISLVFAAALFQFTWLAPRPLSTLSAKRPQSTILSLVLHFCFHIWFLITCVKDAESYMGVEFTTGQEEESIISTVLFLTSTIVLITTYTVNYAGHPFNESLFKNKPFLFITLAVAGFLLVVTFGLFRNLNDMLKLAPLPRLEG